MISGRALLWMVLCVAIVGCKPQEIVIAPAPIPASCASNEGLNGYRFSFDKWKEGLAIMFVDRINGSASAHGRFDGTTYTSQVSVRRDDGTGYEWRLTTTDGRSAELTVNGTAYDLTKGSLFVVELDGEKAIVQQIDRDLSGLNVEVGECTEFVKSFPEVEPLISNEEQTEEP